MSWDIVTEHKEKCGWTYGFSANGKMNHLHFLLHHKELYSIWYLTTLMGTQRLQKYQNVLDFYEIC